MNNYPYKIRLILSLIVFVISVIGVLGLFYKVQIFDLQFLPLFEKVMRDFSTISLILLFSLILITFVFGRIYCSLLCPFGILQEILSFLLKPFKLNFAKKPIKNHPAKYIICSVSLGLLVGGSVFLFKYLDPYTNFGGLFTLSLSAITVSTIVFVLILFKDRFFCTNICPVGAILGLISKISVFQITISDDCTNCKRCEKICPSNCIDIENKNVDNETCIKCQKCIGVCPLEGIGYNKKRTVHKNFSPKRRELILSGINLAIFGFAIKIGNIVAENLPSKIKNIILPPGAISEKSFINKCLNCNLCVKNCPSKVIKTADEEFGAVHLDYTNSYCEYDCNLCSKICPSGAIKKLSLKEKQKTRIAIAVLNKDKCIKCLKCKNICPYNAIIINENNTITLDSSKCVGCGMCKTKCAVDAIEIYSVSEQKTI